MSGLLDKSATIAFDEIQSTYQSGYETFDINSQKLLIIIQNINIYLDLIAEFIEKREYNVINRSFNDQCLEIFFNLNKDTKLPKIEIFKEYVEILNKQLKQFNEILKLLSTHQYILKSFKMIELIYTKIKALYESDHLKYKNLFDKIVEYKNQITKITECTNHYSMNVNEPIKYILYYMSKDKFDDEHDLAQFKKLYKMTPISLLPDEFDKPQTLDMASHNKYVSATAIELESLHVSKFQINNWILLYNKLNPDDVITITITDKNNNYETIFPIYKKILIKINNFVLNNFVFMRDRYQDMICFKPEIYKRALETYNKLLADINKLITYEDILSVKDKNDILLIINQILQIFDKLNKQPPRNALDYLKQFDTELNNSRDLESSIEKLESEEKQVDGGYNNLYLINKYMSFNNKYFNY